MDDDARHCPECGLLWVPSLDGRDWCPDCDLYADGTQGQRHREKQPVGAWRG